MKRGLRLALLLICGLLAGHVGGSYGVELFDLTLHWNVYLASGFPPVPEVLAAPIRVPPMMAKFPAAWWVAYWIAFTCSLVLVLTILARATRPPRPAHGFPLTPTVEPSPSLTDRNE